MSGSPRKTRRAVAIALLLAPLLAATVPPAAAGLEDELGRNETRVRSAAYPIVAGRTVAQAALVRRLERLGYVRTRARPEAPGEYFYGHEAFWIFRRAHRIGGRQHGASLIGLELRRSDGMILGARGAHGRRHRLEGRSVWLEPETLAESLDASRADRIPVPLADLPAHVWQALLAAEDARFFRHSGVDGRSVARAALANLKRGGVAQGGSTLTQQLIKNRDLSPKRSLGRKASEALRALALEADYTKREILEAYLNQVYYGHVEGLAVHGIGAAAQAYFAKPATELTLAEAALLAALIQGPNRLAPSRHPERILERRNWVLDRLAELDWVSEDAIRRARQGGTGVRMQTPRSRAPSHFLSWVTEITHAAATRRLKKRRGVVVETTLDPYLQEVAEDAVRDRLAELRRTHRRLGSAPLAATLVAFDARNGDVLAYVGGETRDGFDRVRQARRQPGSTVKPFVLLEAFGRCGTRDALNPATPIADEPLRLELPSGPWEPGNHDREFRGVVDARSALADSRNVPLVRAARWCGFDATRETFVRVGLEIPDPPPPSFVLGAVETTPLALARAYGVFATLGKIVEPRPVRSIERPAGRAVARFRPRRDRVADAASTYLVHDILRTAVADGTARAAGIEGLAVAAKTGSSSGSRDAWLAGHAGSVVAVVWVGLDDNRPLGLPGGVAAAPIWRDFVRAAAPAAAGAGPRAPHEIERHAVDPRSGLRVHRSHRRARMEVFRRGALPPRDRRWRPDSPVAPVR